MKSFQKANFIFMDFSGRIKTDVSYTPTQAQKKL